MKTDQDNSPKKLKLTSARQELLDIFEDEQKPISFEDVKDKISMDKATFYRNVSKFEEASIINSFESNDKKRYYEIHNTPHAHFICNSCNKIECLQNVHPIELKGYLVNAMIFKGICKSCNKENEAL
ncbi:MAG: transcriptional repressor [Campylobacterota bacterium]|nr:transcriptional repressor [Campylobacterota bacterium]